ncbi:hypothetical protein PPSIR1_32198 [Plesiocystis pacifica SIR-1]|uniref:Lipoprotein n=1 Tax=Plesiocystis pacifica SIR-1 TaxID=391625 RepID=A6G307_9BACT|nr:hypothetical protein [Plesiocystis pacifica]EDM79857.1 hypothetical protein PPSIR1_32198 [Plesiocystis pacifica SIR-1]
MTKTKQTTKAAKTVLTAALLLAVATLMPACELLNDRPCNPDVEMCPIEGHPGTLASPNF